MLRIIYLLKISLVEIIKFLSYLFISTTSLSRKWQSSSASGSCLHLLLLKSVSRDWSSATIWPVPKTGKFLTYWLYKTGQIRGIHSFQWFYFSLQESVHIRSLSSTPSVHGLVQTRKSPPSAYWVRYRKFRINIIPTYISIFGHFLGNRYYYYYYY